MNRLMCHVVAGYPTAADCLALMRGMQKHGVTAIEVQIPFSDPIADGETIMAANDAALAAGMTTAGSLALIKQARLAGVECDLYVMSYLQKVRHFGLEKFCRVTAESNVKGLIIPDLPYDSPEYGQLDRIAAEQHLELVPVLSPGMPPHRLQAVLAAEPTTVYVTSSRGITGNNYAPADQLCELVTAIKQQSKATIMIGFGISTPGDVAEVLSIGDVAVVGSAVINRINSSDVTTTLAFVSELVGPV